MKSRGATLTTAACGLAFLIAALVPVRIFDRTLFSTINGFHSPLSDQVWLGLTTLGDGFLLAIILGAFLLANPRVTVLGLALLLASGAAVQVIKGAFPVPRPVEALEAIHVVGPILRHGGFPSGHSAAVFSAALAVGCYCRSGIGTALVIASALLVAVSRIFVGAHFPSDVVGGMICSLAALLLWLPFVWSRWERKVPPRPPFSSRTFRAIVWLEISAAAFGLLVYGPLFSESAPVAAVVSLAVLLFVIFRVRSSRKAGSTL
jgi:undecaprenyl-diphosphatase